MWSSLITLVGVPGLLYQSVVRTSLKQAFADYSGGRTGNYAI